MAIQIDKVSDTKIWIHDGATSLMDIDSSSGVRVDSALKVGAADVATETAALDGLTATAAELNALAGVTAGTITASKGVVVDASKKVNEWGVTQTITSATPSTTRLTQSSIVCTPTTTFAVAAGGSLAGIRGDITVSADKSFTDGFLYGAQGKVTLNGTIAEASAARITGVLGQTDLASGTVTLGQVSAIWGDLQGNPTLTVNDQVYVGRFTNSMSAGKKAQAFQLMYGAADFFLEASADGGSADWAVVGAGTYSTADAYLLVNIYGNTYRIALFSGTD